LVGKEEELALAGSGEGAGLHDPLFLMEEEGGLSLGGHGKVGFHQLLVDHQLHRLELMLQVLVGLWGGEDNPGEEGILVALLQLLQADQDVKEGDRERIGAESQIQGWVQVPLLKVDLLTDDGGKTPRLLRCLLDQ